MPTTRQTILASAAVILSAAAAFAAQSGTFRVHADGVEATVVSELQADLIRAEDRVRSLGELPDTVAVHVLPDRPRFDRALEGAWGMAGTQCWMVGGADDHALYLLSPTAWRDQACEHDPDDAEHVRGLIAHELVHVYHGQVNPAPDLGELEEIGWLVEGVATYVSGQLDTDHAGRAAEAIAAGRAPERLADAWTGPYRYGVAGSMAAYIDAGWGRDTLRRLLTATSQAEVLDLLGMREAEFLDCWKDWAATA